MKRLILTFLFLYAILFSFAQTYKGRVYDTESKPVPFANVELYSLPDSTFVDGTITNEQGIFLLEAKEINNGYLSISFIGYETATVPARENVGIIILKESMNKLDEVIIKSTQPLIRLEDGKMIVGISGSSLSEAGNLMDILKRTPGLQSKDDKITIFGKGKEVQSSAEYENLQSENITKIEIDRNPSAKYNASDNSVVLITTKEDAQNQINIQFFNKSFFARKYSNVSGIRLNRKWDKTQISTNYSYNFNNTKDYEDTYEINIQPNYILTKKNHSVRTPKRKIHNLFASISQEVGEKHTLGAQFSYTNTSIKDNEYAEQKIQKTNTGSTQRKLNNESDYNYDLATYSINYDFEIDSISKLQLLADYLHSTSDKTQKISENNLTANSLQKSSSINNNNYDVYSAKGNFKSVIVKKLPLQVGIKLSQVENKGATLVTDILEKKEKYTTSNETTDRLGAIYAIISPTLGKWDLEAGIRYEYTDRNIEAIENPILDTAYGKWFPSINISRTLNPKLDFSLSYTKKISRPSFSVLNLNKNYIDSLAYSIGNPKLKATISHNIALNIGLSKRLFLGLEYEHNKQDRIISAVSDLQNPDIVAYTNINIDKSQYLIATLNYRHLYKFWKGILSVALEKPFMDIPYLNDTKKIRKFSYYFQINNDFKVSDKLILFCNFNYNSKSEDLISYYKKTYNLSAGLNALFLEDKLKLGLYINDILNSSETAQKDQYGNIETYSDKDRDNTFLRVSLKYNINSYKDSISKKTAASEEINRM